MQWGHPLLGPRGEELRVPLFAYKILQQLGVKKRYSIQLSEKIYSLLNPDFDSLTEGLRRLVGPDLSGPAWLVCKCRECQRGRSDVDNTPLPRGKVSSAIADRALREAKAERKRLKAVAAAASSKPRR